MCVLYEYPVLCVSLCRLCFTCSFGVHTLLVVGVGTRVASLVFLKFLRFAQHRYPLLSQSHRSMNLSSPTDRSCRYDDPVENVFALFFWCGCCCLLFQVWERLHKGGSLLGDPEERMLAEGQDGNTPGSGLVKVSWTHDCYWASLGLRVVEYAGCSCVTRGLIEQAVQYRYFF